MKKARIFLIAISIITFFFTAESFAKKGMSKGSGGWGPGASYSKLYDPATVETIRGEVVGVEKITPMKGMSSGVHLMVKTDKETIPVHLGPGWFIENQDMDIKGKDQVEVKGSRITFNGKPALIAQEVKKGEETLTLRSEDGFPVWSGARRR